MKNLVAVAFSLSLLAQVAYEVFIFGREAISFLYVFRIVLIVLFALLLLAHRRSTVLVAAARLWIAADFAYSIADRFGVLGPYGSRGVSWGNWKNFVAYTHILNGGLPVAAAPLLAIAATVYEAALVVTLALGVYSRFVYLATSLLTAAYVVTMSFTSGFISQFDYAVLLICSGSLFLATIAGSETTSLRPGRRGVAQLHE